MPTPSSDTNANNSQESLANNNNHNAQNNHLLIPQPLQITRWNPNLHSSHTPQFQPAYPFRMFQIRVTPRVNPRLNAAANANGAQTAIGNKIKTVLEEHTNIVNEVQKHRKRNPKLQPTLNVEPNSAVPLSTRTLPLS